MGSLLACSITGTVWEKPGGLGYTISLVINEWNVNMYRLIKCAGRVFCSYVLRGETIIIFLCNHITNLFNGWCDFWEPLLSITYKSVGFCVKTHNRLKKKKKRRNKMLSYCPSKVNISGCQIALMITYPGEPLQAVARIRLSAETLLLRIWKWGII